MLYEVITQSVEKNGDVFPNKVEVKESQVAVPAGDLSVKYYGVQSLHRCLFRDWIGTFLRYSLGKAHRFLV